MNTRILTRLRALFAPYYLSEAGKRHYMRQWVRSVRNLGDKWLLAETHTHDTIKRS